MPRVGKGLADAQWRVARQVRMTRNMLVLLVQTAMLGSWWLG
jgi:hypothetical protein